MKNILYLAFVEFDDPSDGVVKKIKMQLNAMGQNGYSAQCAAYEENGLSVFKDERAVFTASYQENKVRRFQLLDFVLDYVKQNPKDILYMRFAYSDPWMCSFLRKVRQYVSKIVVEIATYPYRYKDIFFRDKKTWLIQTIDRFFLSSMSKYVDEYFVIGEPVDSIYGVKAINIPNGIDESMFSMKKGNVGEEINIMCLANMYIYQGYDRLISGLYNYQKNGGTEIIKIHLVGDGPELEKYRAQTDELKLDKDVIIHGRKSGKELEDLFNVCNIACAMLAPHRNQIVYASPLKTKEYMLRGIPYIYAYTEIGINEVCEYMMYIKPGEEAVDMEKIVKFFNAYKNNAKQASEILREYAIQNFAWKNILKILSEV